MDKNTHFDMERLRSIPISKVAERWGCHLKKVGSRQVLVFPDRDAIGEWKALLHGMRDIATFSVSDFSETFAVEGDQKFDIADYVVAQWRKASP